MKAVKSLKVHEGGPELAAVDQLLDLAFKTLNAISPGFPPEDGQKAENFDAVWVVYTTSGVPHTEEIRRHRLGRVPRGILEVDVRQPSRIPNAGRVYCGETLATDQTIALRCSSSSKYVCVLVF